MQQKRIAISVVHMNRLGASGANRTAESMLMDLPTLDPSILFYLSSSDGNTNNTHLAPAILHRPGTISNLLRVLWYQFAIPGRLKSDNVGLLYSLLPEGLLRTNVQQIITIHDMMPLKYPQDAPRLSWYYRAVVPLLLKQCRAVIVDCEATKNDIKHFYGDLVPDAHVVYVSYRDDIYYRRAAQDIQAAKGKYGLSQFVLAVGELRPHKNIRRLIEAFAKSNLLDFELAIVGKSHYLDRDIFSYPKSLGIESRVKFLGFVPDDDLACLYSGAEFLAYPSLNEGFGIPLVEAMACGCPVVASNVSCMPEICGEAATYFDPVSVLNITHALERLAYDTELKQTLVGIGYKQVLRYKRQKLAHQLHDILKTQLTSNN